MTTNDDSYLDGMGAVARVENEEARTPRNYNRNPDRVACKARSVRTGDPCNNPPMHGATVCRMHGGSAPQVKAAARVRIERAADRVAKELLRMALDDDGVSDSVKLQALRDALDRGGVSAKTSVEVEVGPTPAWKEAFDAMLVGGSRAESRAARGIPDDATAVLDAEVVGEEMVDGAGIAAPGATANQQAPQPSFDTSSHRQGSSMGSGSGTNPDGKHQSRGDEMRASGVEANYPPIVSLDQAHPDDPPRRIRTNERNRAITPPVSRPGRNKRRRE